MKEKESPKIRITKKKERKFHDKRKFHSREVFFF